VDDAVRRVLRVKHALGLFDDPYRYSDAARETQVLGSPAHAAAARDVARKSIVLLRNEGSLLPLDKGVKTIAVVGPLAADKDSPLGNWRAQAQAGTAVSLLEGVKAAVAPATRVLHAPGVKLVTGPRSFMARSVFETRDRSGIPAAVEAARAADVVVVALGEDAFQSGEGRSQVEIGLKGLQDELLRAVQGVNTKVVVVLMSGRPLVPGAAVESAPALLAAWHAGSQAGHAIADVLFGDHAPSGRLPVAFPRHVGQLPMTYAHKSTGRPGPQAEVTWSSYNDMANDPLYPFGFGLAYTTFAYGEPRLSAPEMGRDGSLQLSVAVTNTGARAGSEVVQLYVRDVVGSVTRPVKELKGFERIALRSGEARDVVFTLEPGDLAFHTASGRREAEPGAFKLYVGANSRDVKETAFTLR
jgi:beta-glucosidase